MKLPNADRVRIASGRSVATSFPQAIPWVGSRRGSSPHWASVKDNAAPFMAELRRIAAAGEVAELEDTAFGRKYTVPGDLTGPVGLCQGLDGLDPGAGTRGCQASHRSPEVAMKFALLDTVVLTHDLPEHGLRAGDLGAVVELYGEDGVEVEFVQASGQTKALITPRTSDLRSVAQSDILAVRSA